MLRVGRGRRKRAGQPVPRRRPTLLRSFARFTSGRPPQPPPSAELCRRPGGAVQDAAAIVSRDDARIGVLGTDGRSGQHNHAPSPTQDHHRHELQHPPQGLCQPWRRWPRGAGERLRVRSRQPDHTTRSPDEPRGQHRPFSVGERLARGVLRCSAVTEVPCRQPRSALSLTQTGRYFAPGCSVRTTRPSLTLSATAAQLNASPK